MSSSMKRPRSLVEDEDSYVGAGASFDPLPSIDSILGDVGGPPAYWSDYNGEQPRYSDLLGPDPMNTYSDFTYMDPLSMDYILGPTGTQQLETMDMEDETNFSVDPQLADLENAHFSQMNLLFDPDSSQESTPPFQEAFQSPSIEPVSSQSSVGVVSTAEDDEVVCYGMSQLYEVDIKLVACDMATVDAKLRETTRDHQYFNLFEKQGHIRLRFPDDTDDEGDGFAALRITEGGTLKQVRSKQGVMLEGVVRKTKLREMIERANKPADATAKVDIYVYGSRREATRVGDDLSRGKMWLQKPDKECIKEGVIYENPHFLQLDPPKVGAEEPTAGVIKTLEHDGVQRRRKREDQMRKIVQEVYRSVENSRNLAKVDGGSRVTNKLLPHQQEALGFMLERESGNINERYKLWEQVTTDGREEYKHKVTGETTSNTPNEKGGGILADVMGMGKSLSILALAMKTLEEGRLWADELNESRKGKNPTQYSGSTLIVVASGLLITNWKKEIDTHLKGGLNVIRYHGRQRQKNLENIGNSDIVLTTYKTLAVEYEMAKDNKEETSVLHQIGWYRVVLDEAHIIRRSTGTFYKSCSALHAESRWCLTGTPIQNRFADIGTLFSFIRAQPFDSASIFRRWIVTPFEEMTVDSETVTTRLITLLGALCLRRTREILHLPGVRYATRNLDFSPEERMMYDRVQNRLLRLVKHAVGADEDYEKMSLFRVNLVLRILCNHGTFQKNPAWARQMYMGTVAGPLGPGGEVRCSGCPQPMPILGSDWRASVSGNGCAHVFCSDCIEEMTSDGSGEQPRRCPLCVAGPVGEVRGRSGFVGMGRDTEMGAVAEDDHDNYWHIDGHSTKMRKIIEDVKVDLWKSKSIIFSSWTRTLDLLGDHLKQAGISYLRIDGYCPDAQRQARLEKFSDSADNPVLIMTTGTGALGINVTCANRIFIVELQWNPSVENQAIARATRLGQEREVLVTRYLIRDTFEESMKKQQQLKKQIATMGFNELPE